LVEKNSFLNPRFNFKNKILKKVSKKILSRNQIFKNIHSGESCYLFGNGASIKFMDLSKFDDKPGLACTFLWLHKDFKKLDVRYYSTIAPFWFYPLRRHPTIKNNIKFNYLAQMQKKILKDFPDLYFFTSLSNYLGLGGKNVYYLHHFDEKLSDHSYDMTNNFFFHGAIEALICQAIYMGFKKAYLVGFDYTHHPQRVGHFYEKGKGALIYDDEYKREFFAWAKKYIELVTITTENCSSKNMNYISYEDYTNSKEIYIENNELVKKKYLNLFHKIGNNDYKIY